MAEKNEMHAKTNTAEQPLVSILIPAYKARWFERALCSALAQDYPKLEILVYDNCPTEDIRDICARYPSVIYYRNPNMGPQNSLDIASASHGRYVKHLFDDDLLEPTCVSQLVAAIQQVPGTLLAFGASWTIDEHDQRTGLRQEIETPETIHIYDGNALCRAFATTCSNMIGEFTSVLMDGHWLRSDVLRLRRAQALNRELFGLCDVICFMNAAAGRPVAFVNKPLTAFRINSESNSNPERNPAFIEAITDWRAIIEEADALGILTADDIGIARNNYNLRASGFGESFPGLCTAISTSLFLPEELPAHPAYLESQMLTQAGHYAEAAQRVIALADARTAHAPTYRALAEHALRSGDLPLAAEFGARAISLSGYPLQECLAQSDFLLLKGLYAQAAEFLAKAEQRHPEQREFDRLRSLIAEQLDAPDNVAHQAVPPSPYERWKIRRSIGGMCANDYQRRVANIWRAQPLFEIFLVVRPGEEAWLADSIDGLAAQYYDGWRLSIFAPFASPEAEFLKPNSPVRWFAGDDAATLLAAINTRMLKTPANWLGFFACGVHLAPEALLTAGDYIALHPAWCVLYSDEDAPGADGNGDAPQFKPDFNFELLRSTDYVGGIFARRDALLAAGGYAQNPDGATYDMLLRLVDHAGEGSVGHIPEVLQRVPDTARTRATETEARTALIAHLERRGLVADILPGMLSGISRRIVYQHTETPRVSIIVPTRNRLDLLGPCIESLLAHTPYPHWELIVVDNGSDDPALLNYFASLRTALSGRIQILPHPGEFNFAAMNNRAAEIASGDYLLLLNDDTVCIHDDWLESLLVHAQRPDVGVVGARLLYPDSLTVQHAGVVLGMSGTAGHVFSGALSHAEGGEQGRALLDQEYSAVTGACLMVRTQVFKDIGGLDAEAFAISYNDIDLCLKVRAKNLRVIYTPHATLLHHGSASQNATAPSPTKTAIFQREATRFCQRWMPQLAADPAWNRHLSLSNTTPCIEDEIIPAWSTDFHDRPRILVMPGPTAGTAEYRNLGPLRALHRQGRVHYAATCQPSADFERAPTPIELARAAPDTLLIHAPVDNVRGIALQQYKSLNSEVLRIFSLDDLITDIPADNPSAHALPANVMRERLQLGLAACDRLIVSTEPLRDICRHLIDDIRLLPNRLPADLWGGLQSNHRHGRKPRVGWAGAQQHAGDLRFVLEVVKATHTEIDWIFFGMLPDGARPYIAEFHPYVHRLADYPAKLASLDLDLAVAPLEVHPFNEAKSNLRLLEYGILGWPVICTDILPYRTDAPPVLRLPNDTGRWTAALRERLAEPDALAREGKALQAWVRRHYLLEPHLDDWYAALTR